MFMDLRERYEDLEELFRLAVEGILKGRRTAAVVQIAEDSADGHTTVAQPTVMNRVQDDQGNVTYESLQPHPDVPVHYASGGGHTTTHPVSAQDTGLVVYADRAIDDWHAQGGQQQPTDARVHSLSDAIYIPGVRSDANKLQNVSQVSGQARSDDGNHFYDWNKTNGLTHSSTKMVASLAGTSTALVQTPSGHSETSPKITMNCAQA